MSLVQAVAARGNEVGPESVIGVVSLLLWLLNRMASFRFPLVILRADKRGQGGTLSLLTLGQRALGRGSLWLL